MRYAWAIPLLSMVALFIQAPAWADPTSPSSDASTWNIQVTPSWEGAPWVPKIQQLLNVASQAALVCCALAFILGGAAMAVGRVIGSNQAGNRGLQFLLGGAGGAIVVVSAPAILSWLIA